MLHTRKICNLTPVHATNTPHTPHKQHHITTGVGALVYVCFYGPRLAFDDLRTITGGAYVRVCEVRYVCHMVVKIVCGVFDINQVVGIGL